jgi:hypothetical protein
MTHYFVKREGWAAGLAAVGTRLAGGLRMLQMGVHTHLITGRAAIRLMLRPAPAHGTRGLVVEMTDGTPQANAEFRRNVGFYYDLVKANVERHLHPR